MKSILGTGTENSPDSSLDFSLFVCANNKERSFQRGLLEQRGLTDTLSILSPGLLVPIADLIYSITKDVLEPHSQHLSWIERLQVPLRDESKVESVWSHLMETVNKSVEFNNIVDSEIVMKSFESLIGKKMSVYPINRFRSLVKDLRRSNYDWHQDEGVQYAMKVKDLAFWNPTTLWVSINGASAQNSLELLPGSHKGVLEEHFMVSGQGHFRSVPPDNLKTQSVFVDAAPGQGIFFDALTFHRSVIPKDRRPRYSLDLRFCPEGGRKKKYSVRAKFALRRLFTNTEL